MANQIYATIFVSKEKRKLLDLMRVLEQERTGYPITIKTMAELAIDALAEKLKGNKL